MVGGVVVAVLVEVAGVVTVGSVVVAGAVVVTVAVTGGVLVGPGDIVAVCDAVPVPVEVVEAVGLALTVSSVVDGESESWEQAVANARRRLLQSAPLQRVRVDGLTKWRTIVMVSSQGKTAR